MKAVVKVVVVVILGTLCSIVHSDIAVPSQRQLDFQTKHPVGCFFHFGINTFTDQEHGTGDPVTQSPSKFTAPESLDTDQWVQSCVALGGTYAVFTSKHEDGMMNFPTNATNYTIETSPFCQARRAAGRTCDLVAEFLASCDKYNVTRGLYYTAFNNHCKATNTSQGECNTMLRAAFTDVATRYGKIDQFWFDHGNGLFIDLIDKYQPEASILGREWTLVGTEGGYVLEGADTTWYPAYPMGTSNASENTYLARQCDTTPSTSGWFWHPGAVPSRDPSAAVDLYWLQCIGYGAGLILNLPPSTNGVVEPPFATFAAGVRAEADRRFGPAAVIATNTSSVALATTQGPNNGVLAISFPAMEQVTAVSIKEDLSFGQRVSAYVVDGLFGQVNGAKSWYTVGAGSTVGANRIWWFEKVTGPEVRPIWAPGPLQNCFGIRFRPLATVAADGLVHMAELTAYRNVSALPTAKLSAAL